MQLAASWGKNALPLAMERLHVVLSAVNQALQEYLFFWSLLCGTVSCQSGITRISFFFGVTLTCVTLLAVLSPHIKANVLTLALSDTSKRTTTTVV